jgi:hypothetical protein
MSDGGSTSQKMSATSRTLFPILRIRLLENIAIPDIQIRACRKAGGPAVLKMAGVIPGVGFTAYSRFSFSNSRGENQLRIDKGRKEPPGATCKAAVVRTPS